MKTISIHDAKANMVLARDASTTDESVHAIVPEGTVLTDPIIKRLKQHDVKKIVIVSEEKPEPVEEVAAPAPIIKTPQMHSTISPELRDDALNSLDQMFKIVELGSRHSAATKVVKHLDRIVEQLIESVRDDSSSLVNVNDLRSYDEYTYHHSLSVAVLSIAIGQSKNIKGKLLEQLGRSAIMHDIGKTAIPKKILNKPARLTDAEFTIMKLHSDEGYRYMQEQKIGDKLMWDSVLLHHEKYDGTGYPLGISGKQIPLFSRIIAVADVYDALTSNRPYRTPMQPAEAIEFIMANASTHFDYDIVTAFLEKLDLYPVGSYVELSNERIGVVLDNKNTMRPVVQMLDTGEVLNLYNDYECLSLTIIRAFTREELDNTN